MLISSAETENDENSSEEIFFERFCDGA
jgi:hypothetical protein